MGVKTDVVNILNDRDCNGISFKLRNARVSGSRFAAVAAKINSGDIQVVVVPGMVDRAKYVYERDTLQVGPSPEADLVIHEAMHAFQDIQRQEVQTIHAEACAYVAQCLYIALKDPTQMLGVNRISQRQRITSQMTQCTGLNAHCAAAIGSAAGLVALSLFQGRTPLPSDVSQLYSVISAVPEYAAKPSNVSYDGLNHRFMSTQELQQVHGIVAVN